MNYPVKLQGFESQTIEVQPAGFVSGQKLLVNGQPAPKGKKRGEMILRRDDGKEVIATWKPQLLGFDMPQLIVDGQTIQLVEPLKWYEWGWSALPILLVFAGGLLGALAGFIGFTLNAKIFRSEMNGMVKFILTGGVSILAAVVYFVAAMLLLGVVSQ